MTAVDRSMVIIPRTVDEVRTLAAMFAKSNLLPPDLRGKEADVFVSIMAGQELGLPPMAALRGVHVVKGKPVLSADTMVGIVLGSGLAEYFSCIEESATSVTYETKRKGSPHPQLCTWNMTDAQQAGLGGGDNWKKYPRAMLKARCKAMLARDVYPDVLAGCYDDDEAREFGTVTRPLANSAANSATYSTASNVVDAEIVSETLRSDAAHPAIIAINEAADLGALQSLVPMLAKLSGVLRVDARERFAARKLELTANGAP